MFDFTTTINQQVLEFFSEDHQYLVNGQVVPSITQILHVKFGDKYRDVSQKTLNRAAERGTKIHDDVEQWCQAGLDSGTEELRNFKFLMKQYGMAVKNNELPVILNVDDKPFAAGRIDLILEKDGLMGLGDIKSTAVLDRDYLAYQLNLYRLAFQQSYHTEIHFLAGVHLREDKRKLAAIAIDENKAYEIINTWRNSDEHNNFVGPDI